MPEVPSLPRLQDAVVFHHPCQDGVTAAWLASRTFAPAAALFPYAHGGPVPEPSGFATVWVFDVGFDPEVLERWASSCRRVLVFDHHLSFQEMMAGRPDLLAPLGVGLRRSDDPDFAGVSVSVCQERSGAGLAALVAAACGFPDSVPDLVWDVEDRDLWAWEVPGSAEVCAMVAAGIEGRSPEEAFESLGRLASLRREHLVQAGGVRLSRLRERVLELVGTATVAEVAGFDVPFVLLPDGRSGSDVAAELLRRFPTAPFVAFGSKQAGGGLKVGLRSQDSREDVSEVAKLFGGGGHRNASGLLCRDVAALSAPPPSSPAG